MDKRRFTAPGLLIAAAFVIVLLFMTTRKEDSKVNIGKSDIRIEDGRLTPEVL